MIRGICSDANHRRAQHFAVESVAGLQFFEDGVVGLVSCFDSFDGMMKVGIEGFGFGFNFCQALFGEDVEELFANKLEAFAKFVVSGVAMRGNGTVEAVKNGKEAFDEGFGAAMALLMALAVGALAVIVEIGLKANERVLQIGFFDGELFEFVADNFFNGRAFDELSFADFSRRIFRGGSLRIRLRIVFPAHDNLSPFNSSEKNCDISATTVMTRS